MKYLLVVFTCIFLSINGIAQGPRFDLSRKDFNAKTLVLLDMDTLISQADSLQIARKWIGSGIVFQQEDDIAKKDWKDENKMFVGVFPINTEKSFVALVPGGNYAEGIFQNDTLSFSDLNRFIQFLIIDADKRFVGLEPTFVLGLCDLALHGANGSDLKGFNKKIMTYEWLTPFERVIMDEMDIARVYRHQSELQKINVNTIEFADSSSFKSAALSEQKNTAYADRQNFEYKGKKYIINYIYIVGDGLSFYNIEPRNTTKSIAEFSRSYLQFLFQEKPMKAEVELADQLRAIPVPNRQ